MNNDIWIELSQRNLNNNIEFVSSKNIESKLIYMLKSNAYGHGIDELISMLPKRQIIAFTDMSDCIKFSNSEHTIIHFNKLDKSNLNNYINHSIIPMISSFQDIAELKKISKPLNIIIKIDTGMKRFGLDCCDIDTAVQMINNSKNLQIHSIATHFSSLDDPTNQYNNFQLDNINKIKSKYNYPIHYKNSAGSLQNLNLESDYIRPGISIYGYYPSSKLKLNNNKYLNLKPILRLLTKSLEIKTLNKGETLGYSCTYIAKNKLTYAILPIGYYHGLPRYLSNKGTVYCNKTECPIIGNICMNHTFVDISNINIDSTIIDNLKFEVIGDKEKNNAEYISRIGNTIPYEVLINIKPNIQRVIVE